MKPFFIAISGKKGSGKDSLATQLQAYLHVHHDLIVEITHFADPLKEMCIQLFGLDRKRVYGSNADKETLTGVLWDGLPKEVRLKYSNDTDTDARAPSDSQFRVERRMPRTGPMTHRELLQVMGTDIFRERVYQNIWAEYPFKQDWRSTDVVIIADCRFPNEVFATLNADGMVLRIDRKTTSQDQHPSEIALDNFDWNTPTQRINERCIIVDNNGTLENLETEVQMLGHLTNMVIKVRREKDGL